MKHTTAIMAFLISCMAHAETISIENFQRRHRCPQESKTIELENTEEYLKSNSIQLKTPIDAVYLSQFLNEYKKFPEILREKMITAGAVIHLIQGNGVTDDPTWATKLLAVNQSAATSTTSYVDNRMWADIPGAGGMPHLGETSPTRVVVNHLYDKHGSANLFLHEHGHSLDRIKGFNNPLSNSPEWQMILNNESTQKFIKVICGKYCETSNSESFAELFAYFNACSETKNDVETYLPEVFQYFTDLPRVI